MSTTSATSIDRKVTTPFLLKLFYRNGSTHRADEFVPYGRQPPHVQIYTWQSCTLGELTFLLTSALPNVLPSPANGTRLSFKLIYPDTSFAARSGPGHYLSKELGSVVVRPQRAVDANGDTAMSNSIADVLDGDADKTLQDARFVIGDYICCAIFPPLPNGEPAPPPPSGPSGGGYRGAMAGRDYGRGPPRENGYGAGRDGYGRGGGYGGYGGRGGGRPFDAPPRVPEGEWRRGERLPAPDFERGGSYGRGRGPRRY